jgi:cell division protein FtsL
MNRLFYFLASVLFLLIILLLNSIFFGTNSYSKKSQIINENNLQKEQNDELKKQNDALEFEIQNAQKSKEHVENFAREKLNLVYPDEEFITFKEEDKSEDEK